jgi:FKBP-type peptidyl-prolyl cis-trans isomerase
MISKYEILGFGISVLFMALALYLVRIETSLLTTAGTAVQVAAVAETNIITVKNGENVNQQRATALVEAADSMGNIKRLVIDDIKIGNGTEVKVGDTVSVHYIGTLQDGTEFDNSNKRGTPFSFTVGQGRVIKGWEDGLVGMKVGGQRILVIPPELAYGRQSIGVIPANSTLVFAIELLEVKE